MLNFMLKSTFVQILLLTMALFDTEPVRGASLMYSSIVARNDGGG